MENGIYGSEILSPAHGHVHSCMHGCEPHLRTACSCGDTLILCELWPLFPLGKWRVEISLRTIVGRVLGLRSGVRPGVAVAGEAAEDINVLPLLSQPFPVTGHESSC